MKRLENNIYILDSNENLKESLRPQAFERKRQIGSSDVIQFETDQFIDKNDRLIWHDSRGKWHEYIVRGMDGEHDVSGVTKVYYAESSVYELVGDWIGNLWTNVNDSTALDALTRVLTDTEHGHRRTRWDVGSVPATVAKELNFKETTAYDALKTICDTFNLELETEVLVSGNKIIKRNIHLTEQRGADYGKRFTWRKDLTSVERRVIQEDVITALKGYGKPDMIWDGHPVRLTFETINPTGLDYVYSNESRDRWGRLNADGTRSHFYGAVEFNDVTDPWELLEKTKEHFEIVSVPQVEYEAQVEDMTRAGWDHEGVDLGDLVLVIDEELDVRIKARVMELTQDVEGYATKIIIGNFRESWTRAQAQTTKAVSTWRSKVGVWDRASSINPDGTVNADIVEGIKDSWEQDMNAGLFVGEIETMPGGFRFINEDQSWATEIGVMGIRIADTKLSNGEWNFTSFMTGKGFAADAIHGNSIIGGTITGDHIVAGGIDAGKITVGGSSTLTQRLADLDDTIDAIELSPGHDGKSSYLHIAYADNASGGGMNTNPAGKTYIGHAVTETATPPTAASAYTWSKYVGDDGPKGDKGDPGVPGIPGTPGADGSERWIWIRYAEDATGNGMSDYPEGKDFIGVSGNQTTSVESDDPADYIWSRINDHSRLDELGQLQEELQQAVQGGGRNLWLNSDFRYGTEGYTKYLDPSYGIEKDDIGLKVNLRTGGDYRQGITFQPRPIEVGKDYVVTAVVKGDLNLFVGDYPYRLQWVEVLNYTSVRTIGEDLHEFTFAFNARSKATERAYLYRFNDLGYDTFYHLISLKAEEGTIPTAYSRAPEDIEADIAAAQARADEAVTYYTDIESGRVILGQVQDVHDRVEVTEGSIEMINGSLITKVEDEALKTTKEAIERILEGKADASELNGLPVGWVEQVNSIDQFKLDYKELETRVEDGEELNQLVTRSLTWDDGWLSIGADNSSTQVQVTDDRINFMDGGAVVAYITGQTLYINSATILSVLQSGNHVTSAYGTNGDITVERWNG